MFVADTNVLVSRQTRAFPSIPGAGGYREISSTTHRRLC